MNIYRKLHYLLLGIVFLVTSCSGALISETDSNIPTNDSPLVDTDSGYPSHPIVQSGDSGYPPPPVIPTIPGYPEPNAEQFDEIDATPGPIPQPSSSTGVIVGTIKVNNDPVPNLTIYLAEVLTDDVGIERVASYDRINSPRAFTNVDGQFVFSNIEPGNYGLVLDTVISAYLLHMPQEESAIIIAVDAGQQTDVEMLNYDSLPLP